MSVTVPTVLPIDVGTDGTVSTATDAKIVNNSFGAVKVNSVIIEAAQNWQLTAFGDKATLAREKVDSNKFGFQPVSYTHLDVYKRQARDCSASIRSSVFSSRMSSLFFRTGTSSYK